MAPAREKSPLMFPPQMLPARQPLAAIVVCLAASGSLHAQQSVGLSTLNGEDEFTLVGKGMDDLAGFAVGPTDSAC